MRPSPPEQAKQAWNTCERCFARVRNHIWTLDGEFCFKSEIPHTLEWALSEWNEIFCFYMYQAGSSLIFTCHSSLFEIHQALINCHSIKCLGFSKYCPIRPHYTNLVWSNMLFCNIFPHTAPLHSKLVKSDKHKSTQTQTIAPAVS